jgi:hypothetical protein
MIVTTTDLKQRIQQECRDSALTPQFPMLSRSTEVFIPHLDWFKKQWFSFWCEYKASRNLKQLCNLVAGVASAEGNWCAWLHSMKEGGRYTIPIFEARVQIHRPPLLGIYDGAHSNCLIAFTEDGESYQLALWEPQQPETTPFRYALLKDALSRCDLYDILL